MKRTFNYTGRRKIGRKDVSITLRQEISGWIFDAELQLADHHFPRNAEVWLKRTGKIYGCSGRGERYLRCACLPTAGCRNSTCQMACFSACVWCSHRDRSITNCWGTQPERAVAMLCNPLWKPGEIAEQLASRKELVTNHAVADVATRLYYDPTTGSFKRGAGSDVKGAARRLATLFNQLDLTFYLYGMSCDEMLALFQKNLTASGKSQLEYCVDARKAEPAQLALCADVNSGHRFVCWSRWFGRRIFLSAQ